VIDHRADIEKKPFGRKKRLVERAEEFIRKCH
jgi:hypothetical protein